MNSSKDILRNDLRDNQARGFCRGYQLGDDDYDKGLLRLLSNATVGELASQDLLVYPQSFNQGNASERVIDFDERDDGSTCTVYTGNMMGFVGRGSTDLHIHSRFGKAEDDYLLHYMLLKIGGLNVFRFATSMDRSTDKIHNLLVYLFPKYLKRAVSKGLLKSYIHRQYNDQRLKGHIDLARHIKFNEPRTGRIAYDVREYSADNAVTELVRHCIEHISRTTLGRQILSCDLATKQAVSLIRDVTPSYHPSDLGKVVDRNLKTAIHPLYKEYRPLQRLAIAILRHRHFNYSESTSKAYGILFDGAWLWEEYLGKLLVGVMMHKKLHDGAPIYLFRHDGHRSQTIVPDFLSEDESIVADAKYIPLDNKLHLPEAQAAAVYYKTIMYMYRFQSRQGLIFYPSSESGAPRNLQIEGTDGRLCLLGLPIADGDTFADFCKGMKNSEDEFLSTISHMMHQTASL